MNKIKKLILVIIESFLIITSLMGCSNDSGVIVKEENTVEGPYSGKTIILHTNDIHGGFIPNPNEEPIVDGGLAGYATIAFIKKDFESKGANVILVDNGDFSQGSIYTSIDKGSTITELMNKIGYDVVTLGNHEFSYGLDELKNNLQNKNFNVVCANVFEGDKTLYNTDVVYKVGKLKIGFFGLLTPETQTKVNPKYVKDLTFTEKDELYAIAQNEVDTLSKKANLVICLSHLGNDKESTGNRAIDVYANTTGIDFIIDGHSHKAFEKGDNGEPMQSTGTKLQNIGVIVIDNKTKQIENNYLLETNILESDAETLDMIMAYMTKIDEKYGAVFANSEADLVGVKEQIRTKETNLGDLVADAMLWKAIKNGSIDADDKNVVVIINSGVIRNSISKGDISMKDVNSVLPHGNTLSVDYVSGAELLEVLEASTFITPEPSGGFPQVAGIKFTIDTTKEYDAGSEYPNSTYKAPKSITRVSIDEINGQPFDEHTTYAVITSDFLTAGGDSYYMLKKANDERDGINIGIPLDQVVIEYVSEALQGKIGLEYANAQGRITIK